MKYIAIILFLLSACEFEKKDEPPVIVPDMVVIPEPDFPDVPEIDEPEIELARCLPGFSWGGNKCSKNTKEEDKLNSILDSLRRK